jgi:hypothetical protein
MGCHVGEHSADGRVVRDVNHDLIAAGHPRLNFEFTAFLDNMPPHWDEKGANAGPVGSTHRAGDFEARAWAIGRLTTTKAAIALLIARIASVEAPPEPLPGHEPATLKLTPRWPEFAEYGCFSCHHDLRDQAWRREPGRKGGPVGSPRWGTWILPGTPDLLNQLVVGPDAKSLNEALEVVAVRMEKLATFPQIKPGAHASIESLEKCLSSVATQPFDVATIERLIDKINSEEAWNQVASWDEATQRYLALVPLYQSWLALSPGPSEKQQALRKRLDDMSKYLIFQPGSERDLRLMSPVTSVSDIPTRAKDLIIVAAVDDVLLFRIFDGRGHVVLDEGEKSLPEKATLINELRQDLVGLWPPHELTADEKSRVITALTAIVGPTRPQAATPFLTSRPGWWSPPQRVSDSQRAAAPVRPPDTAPSDRPRSLEPALQNVPDGLWFPGCPRAFDPGQSPPLPRPDRSRSMLEQDRERALTSTPNSSQKPALLRPRPASRRVESSTAVPEK